MLDTRVKTSLIVENQLPTFVQEEFPLVGEFLKQYYISLESQGNVSDILQNIDQYVKIDNLSKLNDSSTLTSDVSFLDTTINVNTTYGYPEKYGLIQIDDEIITYTSKTSTSFDGCIRGFSGVTSLKDPNNPTDLVFSNSSASDHISNSVVTNLSVLFLKEFFKKIKSLITPGFENITFDSDLNQNIFIKQSRDFYTSKGTDESFKILFGALYGENVNVIKPRDFLIRPSDSQYRITKDLVIEVIEGDPFTLLNRTIFQQKQQNIESAYGSVSNVQSFTQNNKDYYVLSLDYDYNKDINVIGSIYGNFAIHPKTKLLTEASINQSFIDVDSTIGFPNSGSLIVYLENDTTLEITYTSKSLNQFVGCSGITQTIPEESDIRLNVYASNYESETINNDLVKFNITGVLSDFEFDTDGNYFSEGDEIYIKSLGKKMSEQKYRSFLYNLSVDYDINTFRFEGNETNLKYSFQTFDENVINIGDKVLLRYIAKFPSGFQQFINRQVEEVVIVRGINIPKKEFSTITSYQVIDAFSVKRLLSKSDFENYPEINGVYNTNVSNTYVDDEGNMYVAASSLPSYERSIQTKEKSISFGGISGETKILVYKNHGFYTGESVTYTFTDEGNKIFNLEEKRYYIERLDSDRIKLYNSPIDIYTTKYSNTAVDRSITLYSTSPSSNQTNKLTLFDVSDKNLENSKIIRKFSTPADSQFVENTKPGFVGLFVNGVEILNYKSKDSIYYGPIESIDVIDSGSGYDVINPPILRIEDNLGYGATANINVSGSLERIEIIDQGHDYLETPIITITGGNGVGAVAKANLVSYDHVITFNASQYNGSVNLANDTIGFSTYHRLRNYEEVVYETYGQSSIVGLTTGSTYCAKILDSNTIRLFKNVNDAVLGINTVGISSFGQGVHSFVSKFKKKKLGSISIVNRGSNYSYRKNTVYSSGISTARNIISIKNHGYIDGEIVNYSYSGSPIGGLSSTSYYVKVINTNEFQLSEIGYGSTERDFYYKTNQIVNLTSAPSGHHTFNYPPIQVTISGRSGVSTFTPGNQNAVINPIFRGSITSVSLASTSSLGSNIGGIGYGSKDIINLIQQPNLRVLSGSGAQLTPIISNGKIVEVIVENGGSDYNSTPDLEIVGTGEGAVLTPVISNGRITRVIVISGGIGYERTTFISVKSSGFGADLFARIKEWNINVFEKETFVDKEGGIITKSLNNENLQYSQVYLPEFLRKIVFSQVFFAGDIKYISDFNNDLENNLRKNHSPIVGWAYDGNPIYGPYGYSNPLVSTSQVRRMISGYVRNTNLQNDVNRPSFEVGFFTNDYAFKGVGDLDEHNGRYCITPEFPNGTYAYFCTFDLETGLPAFPYVIGNTYKNLPIKFNFDPRSNENDIDLNNTDLKRNTYPYNLNLKNSRYPYIFDSNSIKPQVSRIKSIFTGSIDSVGIETGGIGYRVGDNVLFNDEGTGGFGSSAVVSSIKGKDISTLSYSSTSFSNIEFINYNNSNTTLAICTSPHGLNSNDIVSISGLSTSNKNLFETYQIRTPRSGFKLSTGIGSTSVTGIITYFNVLNNLSFPEIIENDVLGIGTEKVKVLSVDQQNSRIKVLRCFDNTVGSSHSTFEFVFEYPRKFLIDGNIELSKNYKVNREYYFNPVETLGVGTQYGVGIGTTIYFSNPGSGVTSKFIPSKTLYFKNHNLNTGDVVIYSPNSGTPISVSSDGSNTFELQNQSILYVAKVSDDLIGISTFKVGLSTTGEFVGVESSRKNQSTLFLTSIGSGINHSFKTNYQNVLTGSVDKIISTITTFNPHGLNDGDSINLKVLSGISTTIKVSYNDKNSRVVFDPRSFVDSNVNSTNNTITIVNHSYETGEKIIHTSSSPVSGLEDNEIYYVVVIDKNTIKLSRSYYQSTLDIPETLDLSSTTGNLGTIYKINPKINAYRNQNIIFDLSDSSLSFVQNSQPYSAFKLEFFTDRNFINRLKTKNITQIGEAGLTGSSLTIKIDSSLPPKLYYKLTPFNANRSIEVSSSKQSVIEDSENIGDNNTLIINDSLYSGTKQIVGVTTYTASFAMSKVPESNDYTGTNSDLSYEVLSGISTGPITSISIINGGKNYSTLPSVSSIESEFGSGAITFPESKTIGKIKSVSIIDYGFDYSVDRTIVPLPLLPQSLKVDPLNSIDKIEVISIGKNYTSPPTLITIDNYDNNVVEDVELDFSIKNRSVSIVKNTKGIYGSNVKIIPINNSNGMKIKNIGFNTTTKDVTVTLDVGFLSGFSTSTDFPFLVGDKILIENTSVSTGSTGTNYRGYNSKNYNYELFTIKSTDPNIGGVNPSVVFNLSNYFSGTDTPGTFNSLRSSGRIVAEKDFPIFNVSLKKNEFIDGEIVTSDSLEGKVQKFDIKNNYLKVSSRDNFTTNQELLGKTSGSKAVIIDIISYDASYNVNSNSIAQKGSKKETGFLNNNNQRIHDNDYYQDFSYSLRSKVPYDKWSSSVDSLNHTSGFKKFSDLVIESNPTEPSSFCGSASGICTNQNFGIVITTADILSEANLNCVYDFDLAFENSIDLDDKIVSDEIIFNSRVIQDYIEASGNVVLKIDDISSLFDSTPRVDVFSVVDDFDLTISKYKKYFIMIEDNFFNEIKQFSIVSLLHDETIGFINQYGNLTTFNDLGSFDFRVFGTSGQLLFYPSYTTINDYNLSFITYDIDNVVGVGTTTLGDTVKIESHYSELNVGYASTSIVSISSTYRASKLLIEISSIDSSYNEVDELTLVHDGSDVYITEYGQLDTDLLNPQSIIGIGAYDAYISDNKIFVDLTPNVAITTNYTINTASISIGNTASTGIGTYNLSTGKLKSDLVSISASVSPVQNIISSIDSASNGAYCIVSVEDTTNNQYSVSELLVVSDGSNAYITEFGSIETISGIGTFSASITGSNLNVNFTPIPNIDVQVRSFILSINRVDLTNAQESIDLESVLISPDFGFYTGTENDVRKSFYLTHNHLPIFHRYFDGSDNQIVDTENNIIKIADHFFRSGEKITYYYDNYQNNTENAIGIGTTYISVGVGTTNKLPRDLYVVKVDEYSIKLATTAENALKLVPEVLDLTSVGIGTNHRFVSDSENRRVLISIDNMIQSPLVSTATTTTIVEDIGYSDTLIRLSNIIDIFPENLLKINDEILRVSAVGVGSTNIVRVQRRFMGSELNIHSANTMISRVEGNYNIVDNTINFVSPPYGPSPIGTITNPPDERDYVGITTYSRFNGRVFFRSSAPNSTSEPYEKNYIFDDISHEFSGIKSDFQLKVNRSDVTGISSSNAILLINGIFQGPENSDISPVIGDYYLEEKTGITSVYFKGSGISTSYDINTSGLPIGGIIVSVGSTAGFGYQPLVSAGGTAIVSIAGTIQSISIGNSGSGYRSGVQVVNVGVTTASLETPDVEYIGTANVSDGHVVSIAITNPGTGYTSSNPPIVIFDSPLSYENIPLIYSSSSSGVGTESRVNIVVGQGSSVIDFEIINDGYNYKLGDILTIPVGGATGIPTDPSKPFNEFKIFVDRIYNNKFSAWSVGDIQILDDFSNEFNGVRKSFQLKLDNQPISILAAKNTSIDLSSTLIVFINDILQVPGESYIFDGGSIITFTEAPKSGDEYWDGDTIKIYFYRGTSGVDTKDVDILETVKVGDDLQLYGSLLDLIQNERSVDVINSSNSVITNTYSGPGISTNEFLSRPVIWCRQTEDRFINGKVVGKDRQSYEPNIEPVTSIIQNVGIGTTIIFVQSVRTFFDNEKENASNKFISKIKIISQDSKVGAYATAIVSDTGSISYIDLINPGIGYTISPNIIVSNPTGVGSTAIITASITNGSITGISTISAGSSYTQQNPPSVLIESPFVDIETIENISYEGDFGIISGISTGSIVGVASTALIFDLLIENDSFLRDTEIVGTAVTISGIQTGYYFIVQNSNIGYGITSLDESNSMVGVGTTFIDNLYKVAAVSIASTDAIGIGQTYVAKVVVSVSSYNGLTGIGYSGYYGEYSWGKITFPNGSRLDERIFTINNQNGVVGLETAAVIKRFNPLRYFGYSI